MYSLCELESRRLLEQKSLSDSVVIILEKHIAFSLVAQGKTQSAIEHFVAILEIDSNYELDPALTSPKILTVFNKAKELFLSQNRFSSPKPRIDTIFVKNISYRTIIFPGLEQLNQERKATGWIFFSSGALALGSTLIFDILRRDARKDYLNAYTTELAQDKYDSYNNYNKAEIYSAITFALIYISSQLEVFFNTPLSPISVQLTKSNHINQLSFQIKF
jgi:hypothetical protein